MGKKTVNQNTRLKDDELAFIDAVASRLGTNRSDVMRRFLHEWQRFGTIGTAEALRNCGEYQPDRRRAASEIADLE